MHVYDQKERDSLADRWARLSGLVAGGGFGPDYLGQFVRDLGLGFDWVFVTPGMKKDVPEIDQARKAGCRIGSELGLFMSLCTAPMIGITGSSGKTTTASLTARILERGHRTVHLGGNIGRPLINQLDCIGSDDVVVLEISSFQLELADRVPEIGAILNISPNHLDVHGTMEKYIEAKARLARHQCRGDFMLLNADCAITRSLAPAARGEVGFFRVVSNENDGIPAGVVAEIRDDNLWIIEDAERRHVARSDDLPLRGLHNARNVLAAAVLARRAGAFLDDISGAVVEFTPVPHRLEDVGEIGGVLYVNDSIATSPDRTVAAIRSYERPVLLLLGGYDKGVSFRPLVHEVVQGYESGAIRAVYLMGATAEKLRGILDDVAGNESVPLAGCDLVTCRDLEDALVSASKRAHPGDIVLMSPACASYDSFDNFMQRGDYFRDLVRRLEDLEG